MEVGAYLVADAESFELVEPGEGPLYHPPGFAQAGAVWCASARDLRRDSPGADEAPVLVEVVAAVGEQPSGPVAWRNHQLAGARRHLLACRDTVVALDLLRGLDGVGDPPAMLAGLHGLVGGDTGLACPCGWLPVPQRWHRLVAAQWEQHLLNETGAMTPTPPVTDPEYRLPPPEHTEESLAELYDRLRDAEADVPEFRSLARACSVGCSLTVPALLRAKTALKPPHPHHP